ncbi:MAG: hypothetical protein ACXIU8_13140 [Alkalilacustris sp.]
MTDTFSKAARIEVACLVDFEDLDPDDRTPDGVCAVDGSYLLTVSDIPAGTRKSDFTRKVLDHFHARVPIACLEDFGIAVFPVSVHDALGCKDLGAAAWRDAPVIPGTEGLGSSLPEPSPFGTKDPFDPFEED